MPEITDQIWIQNVDVIFQKDRLLEILPTGDMTYSEKLNALMRLSIYLGILLFIVKSNYLFLYIPIGMGLFQYILYKLDSDRFTKRDKENMTLDDIKQEFNNTEERNSKTINQSTCITPTVENPFMNPLANESRYRQPACKSFNDKSLQDKITNFFDDNLFKDPNDIYDKNNSQRQFFTMPYTTYPNDQGTFANWLYKRPPTCKEGNGDQCVANNLEKLNGNSYKFV